MNLKIRHLLSTLLGMMALISLGFIIWEALDVSVASRKADWLVQANRLADLVIKASSIQARERGLTNILISRPESVTGEMRAKMHDLRAAGDDPYRQALPVARQIIGHFPAQQDPSFDQRSFWLHSIGTGIAAQVLARHSGLDAEQAFTAGLLHDIGKLVLAAYFEDDFARVLAWRDEHDCLIREAEQVVLGFDHTEIGARVAQHWKLPRLLVNAIRFHHAQPCEVTPLAELVHVADILCRGLDIGHGGDDLIPALRPEALLRLGLEWPAIHACLPEIESLNASAGMLLDGTG